MRAGRRGLIILHRDQAARAAFLGVRACVCDCHRRPNVTVTTCGSCGHFGQPFLLLIAGAGRWTNSPAMDSSTPRASPAPPSKAEGMASTSRASRGGTPTASRSAARLAKDTSADRPARAASSNSLKQKTVAKVDEPARATRADEVRSRAHAPQEERGTDTAQQLKALKSEFDGLRTHLTCKICDRMLYQPYTIACGHTYCYTVRSSI